ncbi:MAG TPA: bifunctional hydroxymethylpyrimidine kinase/phosphomethylpyrimidine kinase [Terriglobia bacterium]|nr:bifunctional hydroxymethylpyrimidine kinase/phosphomethylpyrimidine kinase [Terriglobia bacterium]
MILTIAGFDPSSGAGITADLKTFSAHNCYGVAAITALTIQNSEGVHSIHPVAPHLLHDSLKSLMEDGRVRAIKIGMLANRANGKVVSEFLQSYPDSVCVLDPVLRSSSGAPLIDESGFELLRDQLLKQVSLVTPNLSEAALLTGLKVESLDEMKAAAARLLAMGARAVVVTGGHLDKAVDIFAQDARLEVFAGDRLKPDNTHGTGCTFSSAVTANLALGRPMADAVVLAKAYVAEAIKKAYPIGPGRIPLNHFFRTQEAPRGGGSDQPEVSF